MALIKGAHGTQQPDGDDPFGYGGGGPGGGGGGGGGSTPRSTGEPIGVPAGYVAERQRMWTPSPGQSGRVNYEALRYTTQEKPRYHDGDQYRHRGLSPAEIWDLQQIMAAAGLFSGSFTREVWDEPTADAYAKVLAYANQRGLTEREALGQLSGLGTRSGGIRYKVDEHGNLVQVSGEGAIDDRAPLVARTTDPKVLETIFRDASTKLMGVALSPAEVQQMAASYNKMEVDRQTAAYNAEVAGGTVLDIPSPEAYGQTDMLRRHAPAIQDYAALENITEALGFLASPAWGVGG